MGTKNFFITLLFFLASILSCHSIRTTKAKGEPIIRVKIDGSVKSFPLETYIARVLAGEVSASWPIEALRAQAVAARTFAIKKMRERNARSFHVESSVMDQVMGKERPQEKLEQAAKSTRGLVLVKHQKLLETSFHSTCGGMTTFAKNVWGQNHDYLVPAKCQGCRNSPVYTWRASVPLKDIEKKLGTSIRKIEISKKDKLGRALSIKLIGSKTIRLSGQDLRIKLGPMKIKSTWITSSKVKGRTWEIEGRGFGHGVGLCQYGAKGMAENNYKFHEILSHYYSGAKIKKIY